MSVKRHIAVLFHENSRPRHLRSTVVYYLADFWREAGHRVTFLIGTKRFVPADLLFVHVNLSVVPQDYLTFAERYPAAVNHRVRDIRKSQISENLVRPGDGWSGPVIVKSDLNFGGRPEFELSLPRWLPSHSQIDRIRAHFFPRPFSSWTAYPIFGHRDRVPDALRADPRLVIERFLPERENDLYWIRNYQFLGDRETSRRLGSPEPLVKAGNYVVTETIETDPVAKMWRERIGLDYGKIDYVIHEGRHVLLDVNKTTGAITNPAPSDGRDARRRHHAAGIESLFNQ
jgi:hypothetical protein